MLLARRLIGFVGFLSLAFPVFAENWVDYYRTGHGVPPNILWDLNQVDLDLIARDGKLLRYRVRIKYAEQGPGAFAEMQVDCADGTRGQLPQPNMHSTYKGTMGGAEVQMVCKFAAEKKM